MYKVLYYLKYIGIFAVVVTLIALFTSLISLTGFNSTIINKLAIILTAISFFFISAIASNNIKERGYILGIKLALTFIIFLILINLIIFKSSFTIDRIVYYTILTISSILGGSFGKNLKIKKLNK